jgi:hypothetical protein
MQAGHPRRPAPPPRRRRPSCLGITIAVGVLLLLLVEGFLMFADPSLKEQVGEQVGRQVEQWSQQVGTPGLPPIGGPSGQTLTNDQVTAQVERGIPGAIAALPHGEVAIEEAWLNTYLAANADEDGMVDDVNVTFTGGKIEADVQALGTQNYVTLGVQNVDGRIVAVDPHLDGPLAMVVSFDEMITELEEQINAELVAQGRTVQHIRIEEGKMVVLID